MNEPTTQHATEHSPSLFELEGSRVRVLGLGVSGLAAVRYALLRGALVSVTDTRENPPFLSELNERFPAVPFTQLALDAVDCAQFDLLVWSPGISIERGEGPALAQRACQVGVAVVGELDIFVQALEQLVVRAGKIDLALDESCALASPADDSTPLEKPEASESSVSAASNDLADLSDLSDLSERMVPPTPPVPRTQVLAVTGTNGKTTVCSLASEMINAVGVNFRAVGNIGPTMLDAWCDAWEADELPQLWLLELSSFQLALVGQFNPDIAVILNLTPDHLDWHLNEASYGAAKRKIVGPDTHLILPAGDLPGELAVLTAPVVLDPSVRITKVAARAAAKALANAPPRTTFGAHQPSNEGDTGLVHESGIVWLAEAQVTELPNKRQRNAVVEPPLVKRLMPVDVLQIRGEHNQLNALAALAMCRAAGLPMADMLHALRKYSGEQHRCQLLARLKEVNWYDDSKGTNVGATCAALAGLDELVWLIAGGLGKDQDFAPLAAAVRQHALGVILIGRDAGLIREALKDTGVELHDAVDLDEAVALAASKAVAGQAVLLSPACASFDMFRSYQDRGEAYVRAVQAYGEDLGVVMELPC